jgi:hypothetical protein
MALGRDPLPSRWRRFALPILIVGAVLAAGPWLGLGPDERAVHFELANRSSVVGIDIAWQQGDELLRRTIFRFPEHDAPRQLEQTLPLRDGSYRVRVRIDRGTSEQEVERDIEIGPGVSQLRIPLP